MGDTERANPDVGKPIRHRMEDHPHIDNRGWDQTAVDRMHLNEWSHICHAASRAAGWWTDLATGEPKQRNKGESFMLMVSELAEGFEGVRKNLMDEHLPHRSSVEVEIADLLIRAFDFAGSLGLDLDGAVREKMAYNAARPDHKPENRLKEGGKQF